MSNDEQYKQVLLLMLAYITYHRIKRNISIIIYNYQLPQSYLNSLLKFISII